MEFFEAITPENESDDTALSLEAKQEIVKSYLEELRDGGDGTETFKRYELSDDERIAVNTAAKLLSVFGAWHNNDGKPTREVINVLFSAFEDSDERETISLLTSIAYYAWLYVKERVDDGDV